MAKRKRRNFTLEFKAEIVLEALRGESSQAAVCRHHNLSEEQVSEWKRQLLETLHLSLNRGIRHHKTLRNASRTLSNSLEG